MFGGHIGNLTKLVKANFFIMFPILLFPVFNGSYGKLDKEERRSNVLSVLPWFVKEALRCFIVRFLFRPYLMGIFSKPLKYFF